MDFPPILSEYTVTCSNLANLCQLTRQVLGRFWRVIFQMPYQLYQLTLSIKAVADRCFCFDSLNKDPEGTMHSPRPVCPRWKRIRSQNDPLNSLDYNLHGICKSPEDPKVTPEVTPQLTPKKTKEDVEGLEIDPEKLKENIIPPLDVDHDPLDKMGTIPQLDPTKNPIDILSPKALNQQDVENEILLFIQGMIQPAQDLLNEIDNKKATTWQDILEQLDKLEQELDPLKAYASTFEKIPKGHTLVQATMKALENKTKVLERELCMQIKKQYRANFSIKRDGHCLFWSIGDLLDKSQTPAYYRKLAADYIRANHQEFASGVADAAKTKQGRAKINEYVKTQGGRQAWFDKLEKKLGKRPTPVDFYCDCLENSNLWGGVNEVIALSEGLKVPILIFSRQDNKTWRFDMKKGLAKFKNKPPLLLYYNGINHYQSLIPIKKQAKN